ncbi:MAG: hypothetical protein Q8R82_19750 [Hyphomonadaceae bacterium]|nr:hypothetical protein [Hyphomonadaceae bacterium]
MIFIEHASFSQSTIKDNFGAPEYSYLFVRNGFRPALDRLGKRVDVADPARDVDAVYRSAMERGEDCVFLSYNPPQKTVVGLACPTLPIFAWEYANIPVETWNENTKHDWRNVLSQTGMAITLSRESAQAVRDTMGADYPVWAIPTPLFDSYAQRGNNARAWREPFDLSLEGGLAVSAGDIDLAPFRPEQAREEAYRLLRVLNHAASRPRPTQTIRLSGVIYTTVLCPADGRKNWTDLVSGFVWAFRDTPDATLLFKLTHATVEDGLMPVLRHISLLGDFKCRIILINGLLSNEAYGELIDATTYCVNTALCEGQCLPLTEYMSAGRPAVAPSHTAMLDYVTPQNSFIVRSEPRPAVWPQDERHAVRARNHIITFMDLVRQYRESYRVARHEPERHAAMSAAAVETMRAYCSEDVVAEQLREVLRHVKALSPAPRQE